MRRWPASAFRLRIDRMDAGRVTRVEPLVFRRGPAQVPVLPAHARSIAGAQLAFTR